MTKKRDGLDPQPERAPDDKGALWLVLTCSQTGYLGVVPIQGKGQINYMTHEVLSFVQSLGYAEVGFYGDNGPTIRQILKTIITSRHALGLKTRIFTTKVKDSAGNSLVENSIQRIRQLACTLVEDVAQKTGPSYPCEHPLWSWAGRHAAWCLNRYQVGRSLTAYEVTQGKRYDGKVARFGEPVYGYCKSRGKADAKWKVGLFLGKTGNQDAWIIGDGVDVMLSRSIRRVDRPWANFLAYYYSGLQTHSFVYQTNFGGRIVPTKRKIIPQKQDGRLLPKLSGVERRFADEEAKLYRSLVGFGIYLSQERIEIGFIIKQLASGMSNPARGHLQVMRKLIGYLKNTRGHYNRLKAPSHGQGVHHHYDSKWILETFTDSDWSGDRKTRRSTSSAVHCLNGIVVYHSS